jgi:hypothetical protein
MLIAARASMGIGGARSSFVSGMDLGLPTGACVAVAGCVIALLALPARHSEPVADDDAGSEPSAGIYPRLTARVREIYGFDVTVLVDGTNCVANQILALTRDRTLVLTKRG